MPVDPPFDASLNSAAAQGARGAELLRRAIELFGTGDFGDAPMARLAAQAIEAAQAEGDRETESVAHFFQLYPSLYVGSTELLQQRLDQARQRCEALGVARGLWLLDELQAHLLALRGRHVEALVRTAAPAEARELPSRGLAARHTAQAP